MQEGFLTLMAKLAIVPRHDWRRGLLKTRPIQSPAWLILECLGVVLLVALSLTFSMSKFPNVLDHETKIGLYTCSLMNSNAMEES